MNSAGPYSPAPAPGHQAPGAGNPVYTQSAGGEGNQSFNPVPPPLMAESSASPANHPASQQVPVTISSEMVAGHFVSQPGQASPQQIPRTENPEAEVSKPMVAVGSVGPVSAQQTGHWAPYMGGTVNPLMYAQPGQVRQVAPCAAESAVNQSLVQSGHPATDQMPALVRAECGPAKNAFGQMPALVRAEYGPVQNAFNTQGRSITARLMSSHGGGPLHRMHASPPSPYSRPAASVKTHQESLMGGQQQALGSGSISQGIPGEYRQQFVGAGHNSRMPSAPIQGPSMASLSQPGQVGPMPGVVAIAGQGFRPQGVPQMPQDIWEFDMHKSEFWRHQHQSLAHLLISLASNPESTFAWADPEGSGFIIFHHKAYTEGQYTVLGSHLASLLVLEADNPNYPYVQWCGGHKTHIVADPALMTLVPFDA